MQSLYNRLALSAVSKFQLLLSNKLSTFMRIFKDVCAKFTNAKPKAEGLVTFSVN